VNEPYDYGTGIGEPIGTVPEMAVLSQNAPNPFSTYSSISFNLPENGAVRVDVLNDRGQVITMLTDGFRIAGRHLVIWQSGDVPSGLYYCRMTIKGHTETFGMMLMR